MPTGLTASIYDGTDLDPKNYLLRVSRGLSFLIHMRDDDIDAPIRRRTGKNAYAEQQLQDALAKVEFFESANDLDVAERQEEMIATQHEKAHEAEKTYAQRRQNYNRVRGEVNKWQPQTRAGRRVKEYALEQIDMSMEYDCNLNPWSWVADPKPVDEYRQQMLEHYEGVAARCRESIERDRRSAQEANQWIDELMEDLERL